MLKLILTDDSEVIDELEFSDSLTHSVFLSFANEIGGPAGDKICAGASDAGILSSGRQQLPPAHAAATHCG